jgi:hypothetical protein
MGPHERMLALSELDAMERALGQMAHWLDKEGYERCGVLLADAQRSLLAAQLLLDRDPDRVRLLVPKGLLPDKLFTARPSFPVESILWITAWIGKRVGKQH